MKLNINTDEGRLRILLIGEYHHTIDAKGRVMMPVKFREDFGDKFVLTKGLNNCLVIYSLKEWALFEARIKELSFLESMEMQRFFSTGGDIELDKLGRMLIPAHLRLYAGLDNKDVVITGASNRAELWDMGKWNEISSKLTSDRMVEIMGRVGF